MSLYELPDDELAFLQQVPFMYHPDPWPMDAISSFPLTDVDLFGVDDDFVFLLTSDDRDGDFTMIDEITDEPLVLNSCSPIAALDNPCDPNIVELIFADFVDPAPGTEPIKTGRCSYRNGKCRKLCNTKRNGTYYKMCPTHRLAAQRNHSKALQKRQEAANRSPQAP
ncbi:hypothetical protein ACHHYP_06927 [Achlya hypogyna]|uniref:Uncharacterized protein n=1 Tax=Achlya hypogyna TaxID=1202772 RepID=A0A1V9ZMZ8_ACHHY|nr:hypothetical protein ACHHYP_06927 [Achlya hypogyna]